MTADDGLVASRFAHFSALLFVFGVSFFPVYAFSKGEPAAAFDIPRRFKTSLTIASLAALASGLSWLLFTAASMADSASEALSPGNLSAVLGETGFGRMWAVHIGLVIALCILTGRGRRERHSSTILLAVLSGACLASLAGFGHTQQQEGAAFLVRVAADGAHLLAAGAWLGGLFALLALLRSRPSPAGRPEDEIGHVLMRFSGMGYGAVAVLLGTGLINTWSLAPSLSQLVSSLYGQLLAVKLTLFALMLLLAAMNRFWLVPNVSGSGRQQSGASILRLRRHVIGEQLLGVLIIALVSVLGTLPPSGDQ